MTLTSDQARQLENGAAVAVIVDETPCVLVRQDVFDRLRDLQVDDADWTEDELATLAARTFADLDRPEPLR